MNLHHKKAITLTELIIAVILLGVAFAAATTFSFASYNFFFSSDRFVQTQLAVSPAIEMIVKDAYRQTGDVSNSGIYLFPVGCTNDCNEVHLRLDLNNPATPNNYTDDTWLGFWRLNNSLVYCSNCAQPSVLQCGGACAVETLVNNRIVSTTDPGGLEGFELTPNFTDPNCRLNIEITSRYNPSQAVGPDNPQVTLTTSVCPRSISLR
jgi:type II secretory pathway pseudopilin PulG